MARVILTAIVLLASGCATWSKTEVNAELGQAVGAWNNPLFILDATVQVSDRVSLHAGHISDPTTQGPMDPNLNWAGLRFKVK